MARTRENFDSAELKECLSHYDLGKIEKLEEYCRGSRKSPKVRIITDKGKFLLKRRAHGSDDLSKVAFTHEIQLHLAMRSFPLPHLIGTRPENNSMLIRGDNIYEVFEYVPGKVYSRSLDATYNSGRILGLYHKLLGDFHSDYDPPPNSYHDNDAVAQAIGSTVTSIPMDQRPSGDTIAGEVESLKNVYRSCAKQANDLGLLDWPAQIVHGDWHPGNMLFLSDKVIAVIDYDAARKHQRVIDIANGALQFSILGGNKDPNDWPDYVDETRFKRFLRGYDVANVISTAEIRAIPYLMCEAMIAESVMPIAATGSFGRLQGFPFLQMVNRKIHWILDHTEELCGILES